MNSESLEKINNALSHKETISIDIDSSCDENGILVQRLSRPVSLNNNVTHQIALVSLETSSYFPNVTSKNNKFFYSIKDSDEVKTITLLLGAYDVKQYNDEIKIAIQEKGDKKENITIEIIESSAMIRITIKEGYKVYFDRNKTWRHCLGFNSKVLTEGFNISDKRAHILPIQKIYVGCDLCKGSLGSADKPNRGNVLYSFPNSKKFGVPLVIAPPVLRRRELMTKTFDSIRLEFFSDDMEPIDFLGSQVTAEIVIFQV
jgi:hypothetical protein